MQDRHQRRPFVIPMKDKNRCTMLPEKHYESTPEHSHSQFVVAESFTFNSTSLNYFGRQTKSARRLAAVCMLSLRRHGRVNVACRIFRYGRSLPDAANV